MSVIPFKPMLACNADMSKLRFPVMASPKLDGIRCLVFANVGPVSRKILPIPNKALFKVLHDARLHGIDGELIAGPPTAADCMQRTTSAVMAHESEDTPFVSLFAFDLHTQVDDCFHKRFDALANWVDLMNRRFPELPVRLVEHMTINSMHELNEYESKIVAMGYEGVMLRDPQGAYKLGRSTVREGALLKVKRFEDAEGYVHGCVELCTNENAQERDALGHAKRSTAKAGKVPAGRLGALRVSNTDRWGSDTFHVGSGFTDDQRIRLWEERESLPGRTITFKFQPVGVKNVPRFPIFKSFRGD